VEFVVEVVVWLVVGCWVLGFRGCLVEMVVVVGHFVSGELWEWVAVGSGLLGCFNGWWWEWVAVVVGGDSGLWLLLVVAVAGGGSGLL